MNTKELASTSNKHGEMNMRVAQKDIGEKTLKALSSDDKKILIRGQIPNDYLTINDISNKIGIDNKLIKKKIEDSDITGSIFRHKNGNRYVYYSPDDQGQIVSSLQYLLSAEQVPEGYLTVQELSKEIGTSPRILKKAIDELRLEGKEYKDSRGKLHVYFSEAQQELARDSLRRFISTERAPEEYQTITNLAEELAVDRGVIERVVKKLQLKGSDYKNSLGRVCTFFSPEEQRQIIDSLEHLLSVEQVPEGYLTINGLSEETGVSVDIIRSGIKKLNIDGDEYRDDKGRVFTFFSPNKQAQIFGFLNSYIMAKQVPHGYLTINDISKATGIKSRQLIKKKIIELKLAGEQFKDKQGHIMTYYSPEDCQSIYDSLDYLLSASEAPDGFLTYNKIADSIGVSGSTVKNAIEELGMLGSQYKDVSGRIATFYSPEEQNTLLEAIESRSFNMSFPENTVAFYFDKVGKSIKWSFRPDWLKNPDTGRNLEVDVFVDPPGIGIEYDGCFYHQDVERDVKKDSIAQKNGYQIIHIREDGCPEMPEGSYCIKRKNNHDDTDLGECIKKCFEIIGIPVPDIDIVRDKKNIMTFMRQRVLDKLDSARTFEELSVAF